ncbi:MAG: hypothetical protein QM368_05360 [Bacillota bacterium]|jgi:hypothetical protein|nr:hypothetical protein [Bacillota bacterium]HHU29305.1 hypothetical protein [Bacillota bacterium]
MTNGTNSQAPGPGEIKQFTGPDINLQEKWSAGIRAMLKEFTDYYFEALTAHNPAKLHFAPGVKFTENGVIKNVHMREDFWQTAGKILLKRTLVDTKKFGTHTEAVMEENGRKVIFAARLGFDHGKIAEIETIIAREGDFAFNPDGLLATKDEDWEEILPFSRRSSRLAMIAAANDYFDMFALDPDVSTPFAQVCDRWENGTQTTVKQEGFPWSEGMTEHNCSPKGLVIPNHGPRRFLVDVEAGMVVAYAHFASSLPDCHLFKMVDGEVKLIHATVGPPCESMNWPVPAFDL